MKTQLIASLKMLLLMTLLLGIIYPLSVTAIAQLGMKNKANGSLLEKEGKLIGSELIGQSFKSDKYFWPRPSAIDYNPLPSGGSNMGPTNQALKEQVAQRLTQGLRAESLFASASGLDPHISQASAKAQIDRIVNARQGLEKERILSLINKEMEPRDFGFLGEERINVLKLNLALDELEK